MELKIEYIAVDDLKPYEKNNKKHEDFDIGEIAKSISKYEMIDPVGIWGKDNTIVEGHGRVLACKQLGRTCYGLELDPKYCDVIIKRWETLTGEKAVKLN